MTQNGLNFQDTSIGENNHIDYPHTFILLFDYLQIIWYSRECASRQEKSKIFYIKPKPMEISGKNLLHVNSFLNRASIKQSINDGSHFEQESRVYFSSHSIDTTRSVCIEYSIV